MASKCYICKLFYGKNMKKLITLSFMALMMLLPSCKSASSATQTNENGDADVTTSIAISMPIRNSRPVNPATPESHSVKALPKATAFRMSGDYAGNVAITLDSQGNLTYFPDPSDISKNSEPVQLAEGWWLNRQGVGINSVFTRYTFAQYAALPSVPSVQELKAAIIPGARVTETISLPYAVGEAEAHLPEINEFLMKNAK